MASLPSGSFEARTFSGQGWITGIGIQANEDGASSFWIGLGKGFPFAKAVGMIRLGAGIHHLRATNTYAMRSELTECSDRAPCATEVIMDTSIRKDESAWSPFGRIIASIQPRRHGPWLDVQATSALPFAEWTAKQSRKVTVRRMRTEEDCGPGLFGPCTHEREWDETSEDATTSETSREALRTLSTGTGWTIRDGNQQWTMGVRWYPWVGALQASMQWSIAFARASR